jgi:carbonic anhydrase/acetyltransferase-like protein (isoleucine patch superfamily)
MGIIKELQGIRPRMGRNCFVADYAVITGDVEMGDECSVWFNAVVRGDVNSIRIGNKVNIQDAAVIHCTYQKAKTVIGNNCSIGHRAIVHGCTLEDNVLIGMGAIVMDHAVIGKYCIVAAGAIVLENSILERGHVYAGSPARKIKPLTEEQKKLLEELPDRYVMYSGWYV